MIRSRGFTLIESIVVIIVLGIAMVTITSFLAPQVASSADPQYQNRSVALGQSLMNQILARGFDEHSDFDGLEATPAAFNDVDDYIGCWYTDTTESACVSSTKYPLANILDENIEDSYANFRVEVSVFYDQNMDGINDNVIGTMKRVELQIFGGNNRYSVIAYKGNY
ncbi:MSHA pilin protein MshD [Vibrio crassostreae]|uniref:type IV pilus modification PilV family protein n=1 Tax=Vibrio crassostreae TaxID=246167 RepID=UPI00063646D2|nr:type II secretion system protein [Vibrio crassostreae]CAK1790114.1 MSHA pilin protein MshD [Vibrio crassostreae]CAK1790957.1 MSHA pilin protein MshD [Vibrio crassostreae]CAK1794147.1 MSHA pilin protein MshD [Vibrio crassostreae]CAK1804913.1 MSHA pilin protein MshD [Vibrio crassostreae]CAK1804988.1 MSHA pilin protein MshD [Vibrio crassostreae]